MNNNRMANSLVQTWVPVTDHQGRTHLEAQWIDAASVAVTHVTHAA